MEYIHITIKWNNFIKKTILHLKGAVKSNLLTAPFFAKIQRTI